MSQGFDYAAASQRVIAFGRDTRPSDGVLYHCRLDSWQWIDGAGTVSGQTFATKNDAKVDAQTALGRD